MMTVWWVFSKSTFYNESSLAWLVENARQKYKTWVSVKCPIISDRNFPRDCIAILTRIVDINHAFHFSLILHYSREMFDTNIVSHVSLFSLMIKFATK